MDFFSFLFVDTVSVGLNERLISLSFFVGILVTLFCVKWIAKKISGKINEMLHPLRKDFFLNISNISCYSIIFIALFFAGLTLPLKKGISIILAIFFIFSLGIEAGNILKILLKFVMERGFRHQDQKTKKNLSEILNTIGQILIWILAALIAFDTLGIAITPFLTSLGIGGIAVAFAAQKLLEDFFSSFSIMGSSPFKIGDRISVAGQSGTVKKIGLRTTTIQTLEGATVVIPNRTVVAETIENSGTIRIRRKRFPLTVVYGTPIEKLKKLPSLLEKIISSKEKTTFEWALLNDFQESSIEVLVSYTIANDDLLFAKKIHDQIMFEILECFEKEHIEFAYPTQTIYSK